MTLLRTLFCAASLSAATIAAEFKIPVFEPAEIDSAIEIGYGVAVADVDGDGRKDIILADKNVFVWYQNPTWKKFVLAEKVTPIDHVCLAAADIDGDGKAEIAVGAGWNPGDTVNSGSVHFLMAPKDRRERWTPIALPHEPTVHRMRWVRAGTSGFVLVVAPLHGRGNQGGKGDGVKVIAYTKPSDPRTPWKTEVIDQSLHMTHNFDALQWDSDVETELLIASKEGLFVLNRSGATWEKQRLGGVEGVGSGEVRKGNLPKGGKFIATVEPMHGNSVVVYTAPTSKNQKEWVRRVVDDTVVDGHAVATGDLARTGSDQLVVGWRAMNRPGVKVGIKLYSPLNSEGTEWKTSLVDDNSMACEDLCLADLNNDGRLDIIAAGRATKNVKIYWNQGVK